MHRPKRTRTQIPFYSLLLYTKHIIIHVVTSDCISITSIMTMIKCCVINFIEPQWTLKAFLIRVHNRHKCTQQTVLLMHVISICEVPNSNVGHITSTPEVFCCLSVFEANKNVSKTD